jgi:uncharacterized protein YkwD
VNRLSKLVKRLFFPHKGNAFRPHALRHKALSIYSLGLILSQVVFGATMYSGPVIMSGDAKVIAKNIITLSNERRESAGFNAITENETLSNAAFKKLEDMFAKGYWDHIGPNGETAWDFINGAGYRYTLAGENLARGFNNSEDVLRAWMESPTHKANILNSRFREIGVAVGSGKLGGNNTTVIVQLFGEPQVAYAAEGKRTEVLGEKVLIPEFSMSNATLPSRTPYFLLWAFIFGLIIVDGVMIRKLGLHASKSHIFNFRVSLLMSVLVLAIMGIGIVGIA